MGKGKAKATKPASEAKCSQIFCSNAATKDGVCDNCWTAIYGGVL
jgi:hypothetical protein